jgi:hypothetical protein
MATHALGCLVFAQQGIFGLLLMIEDDLFPAPVAMTNLALGPEFSLVSLFLVVVLFVTGITFHLELVFVDIALVAFGALGVFVLARQWEFGLFVMIERDFFPAALHMASLALGAEFFFMFVVFVVTRMTVGF